MAKRVRSPAEKYHDRVAGLYDSIYEDRSYWKTVFAIAWRHMRRFLPPDLSVRCLDLGCGTGRWGLRLLKAGYPVDFLDISRKMLDRAAGKLARAGFRPVMRSCLADDAPPPPPGDGPPDPSAPVLWHATVDDLSALGAKRYGFIVGQGDPLGCARQPARAMKELTRLLAPGGVMAMSVDNRWQGLYHYFTAGDMDGLEEFLRTGRTRWVTDRAEERYPIATFTPEGIRALCEKRGLELLSLIGKTVLPLRRFRAMLEDEDARARLVRLEERLHAEEALLANAAHLEFIARLPCKKMVCSAKKAASLGKRPTP